MGLAKQGDYYGDNTEGQETCLDYGEVCQRNNAENKSHSHLHFFT